MLYFLSYQLSYVINQYYDTSCINTRFHRVIMFINISISRVGYVVRPIDRKENVRESIASAYNEFLRAIFPREG